MTPRGDGKPDTFSVCEKLSDVPFGTIIGGQLVHFGRR